MSRLHFKGGAWTNAEDEVMKAALAQYGLRDWERVASMLTKKTSTQCRERWENYLDPRLNIHEAWSLEEEEKLVELQALFPHKWRLISEQLTRRTPNHYIRPPWLCEQRYLELKDEQEYYLKEQEQQLKSSTSGGDGQKQTLESFMAERRRRRVARKTHEERAARADTVSGERFEQEMIDMATSRLANQDQKKGLRKERQRQLAEAAFLAKLESNREGIESGTLSLRQSKKMKKALEEDRQTSGLVDEIAEPDDDDSDDTDDGEEPRPLSEEDVGQFEAIDMYQDQQQAGLVKKQRVLMKDLTAQQRLIQQRQMGSPMDVAMENEEGAPSSSSSSSVRATLTGVNKDLLKQLTSAPASTSSSTRITNGASSTRSITEAAAEEAKGDLIDNLANLFANLPAASSPAVSASASMSTGMPAPQPLAPGKRPRELPVPEVRKGTKNSMDHGVGDSEGHSISEHHANQMGSSSGIPEDLLSVADLPAPRKQQKTETVAAAAAPAIAGQERDEEGEEEESRTPSAWEAKLPAEGLSSSFTEAEAYRYVEHARQLIAVECERAAAVRAAGASPDTAPSPWAAPLPPAELHAAKMRIAAELSGASLITDGRGRAEAAPPLESPRSMEAAVRAYTSPFESHEYGTQVNAQQALHYLSQRVAKQVREVNAELQPIRQAWEQVMATAMLSPADRHALRGFLHDTGRLKGPSMAETRADAEDSRRDAVNAAVSPSLATYVFERLADQLQRAQLNRRFIQELRDRELLAMRQDLDEREHRLHSLQARERILQDLYRDKRVQA